MLTFTPDPGQCANPATLNVQVDPAPVPALDPQGPYCELDGPSPLPTTQDGVSGSWSGPGVSDNNFNPSVAGVGSSSLTFTPNPGECAIMATLNVQVDPAVTPALDPQGPFCEIGPASPLLTVQGGVSGNWSGPGVNNNTFTPSAAGVGASNLTFTPNPGQCANPASLNVEVQAAITPMLTPQGPFCATDPPVVLPTEQSGVSGSWSGPGVDSGVFDPAAAPPGSNLLSFTPNPGECANPATLNVEVTPEVTPAPAPIGPLCSEDSPVVLPGSVSGIDGFWSGTGVIGSAFDPNSALIGPNSLTFTPLPGECATEAFLDITVNPQPLLDPLADQEACDSVLLPGITGANLSGTAAYYTGSNGSGTAFDPGDYVSSSGQYYAYDENGNCFDEQAVEFTVNDSPMLSCGEDTPASSSTANDGVAFINITGGTAPYTVEIDGPEADGVLTTSDTDNLLGGAGQGAYNITVTDDNGCTATCSFTITAPDCNLNLDFTVQDASCPNAVDGSVDLTASNGQAPLHLSVEQRRYCQQYQRTRTGDLFCDRHGRRKLPGGRLRGGRQHQPLANGRYHHTGRHHLRKRLPGLRVELYGCRPL